jgi:hypothetical protein
MCRDGGDMRGQGWLDFAVWCFYGTQHVGQRDYSTTLDERRRTIRERSLSLCSQILRRNLALVFYLLSFHE